MIAMLQAAELASDKDGAGAAAKLEAAAVSGDLDQMYRDILNFKRLTVAESGLTQAHVAWGLNNWLHRAIHCVSWPKNNWRFLIWRQVTVQRQ